MSWNPRGSALLHPLTRTITAPDDTGGTNRAGRQRRFLTLPQICDRYSVAEKTPTNWVRRGYVTLYKQDGTLLLDVDEVDAALQHYGPSKMRDGRKRFGVVAQPLPTSTAVES